MADTPFNATFGDEHKRLLFTPRKGSRYGKGDYKRACKQQPLPLDQLPLYLTDPTVFPKWDPPTLWLGWIISEEDLLKLLQAHYPARVMRSKDGVCLSNIYILQDALCKEFHVDPRLFEAVDVAFVVERDGKPTTALTVGCTKVGVVDEQTRNNIQAKFGLQRPPEWLLDSRDWYWGRRTYVVHNADDPRERTEYYV